MKKSGLWSFIQVGLALVLIWAVASGISDDVESRRVTAYNKAFEEGFRSGKSEGYKEGHEEGYDKGYWKGMESGEQHGYEVGKQDGYEIGYEEGFSEYYYLNCPYCKAEIEYSYEFGPDIIAWPGDEDYILYYGN